jgi:steroid 5-alpha reductase family enzyme
MVFDVPFDLMLLALPGIMLVAFCAWLYSLYLEDVSIVDAAWPVMHLVAMCVYLFALDVTSPVVLGLMLMVSLWAVRLAWFLVVRSRHQPEERRYRRLRNRHRNFEFKSLFLVFILHGAFVWVISSGFAAVAQASSVQWTSLHSLAVLLWLFGLVFETVADYQLHRFNQRVLQDSQTLNTGLWRYCRHPNYFGEFCIWWAWFIYAIPSGNTAILLAPVLMSTLLFKVSGIDRMEREIFQRRTDYVAYKASTSCFLPWIPREKVNDSFQ